MPAPGPKIHGISVPVVADSIERPIVIYGDGVTTLNFVSSDERWGRVTFEKLDAIRVARGEYTPYTSDWKPGDPTHWVAEVVPSPWLHERYEYEKLHYKGSYEFQGDVDDMVRDYSHYLFTFHDEFVEALAAGIWFETSDDRIVGKDIAVDHPLLNLAQPSEPEMIEAHGIGCEIWPNLRPTGAILRDAELCSQKLFQFAAQLDGSASVSWTLAVRVRNGRIQSRLKNSLGALKATYDGIATLSDVRPHIENWLKEVKERRIKMGKA